MLNLEDATDANHYHKFNPLSLYQCLHPTLLHVYISYITNKGFSQDNTTNVSIKDVCVYLQTVTQVYLPKTALIHNGAGTKQNGHTENDIPI